jgi:hypothetical protein
MKKIRPAYTEHPERLSYDTCNAMCNRRMIQSTPAIFLIFLSWTPDVVITVGKVRAPKAGRRSGAPNMVCPHIWWLIQTVKRGVDFNYRCTYSALVIHCFDCSEAESAKMEFCKISREGLKDNVTIYKNYLVKRFFSVSWRASVEPKKIGTHP